MSSAVLHPEHPSLRALPVPLGRETKPTLFTVVDTEEEFDWGAPFARENTRVRAIAQLGKFQTFLDRHSVRPTYVIDYPVASQPESAAVMKALARAGRCTIGAHLHPWTNPPYTEEVNRANSFACNLGDELETAKLAALTAVIETNVGVHPRIYKAGRYGFGPSTVGALQTLQYQLDVSINPFMDNSAERGPNFEAFDARPFRFGEARQLLEVPCTQGFAGFARRAGVTLHRIVRTPALERLRVPGVMRRLGALDKIMLSPETSTLDDMKALTHALVADGVRTFTMTLHSPSVEPGHTPYVRTPADLQAFYDRMAHYFEFFFESLGGVPGTLDEFRRTVMAGGTAA
jgi:hypothetical protein